MSIIYQLFINYFCVFFKSVLRDYYIIINNDTLQWKQTYNKHARIGQPYLEIGISQLISMH